MKHRISKLELIPGYRQRSLCSYWDYFIDGQRLADLLQVGDYIPPFGWLPPDNEHRFAEILLRYRESDFKPGRIPLFVCPECADYGCGVVTCRVDTQGDLVKWSHFFTQYSYEEESPDHELLWGHNFQFDLISYEKLMRPFLKHTDDRR